MSRHESFPSNVKNLSLSSFIAKQENTLRLIQMKHGEFQSEVSKPLAQLALLYIMNADYDKALPLLHKRLVIHEKFGPEDLVGQTLQDLGTTYRLHGFRDIALQHLERALESRRRCYGNKGIKVAETLNSLALIYDACNDTARAEEYQKKSLELQFESSEPEDIDSEEVPWEVYKRLRHQRGFCEKDYFVKFKKQLRNLVLSASHHIVREEASTELFQLKEIERATQREESISKQHARSHSDSAVCQNVKE